jgi:hypothetical protein
MVGSPVPLDKSAYNATGQVAGQECSSTNEGRYVNVVEEMLTHPQHDEDLNLVRKGDPCVTFELVGVAMQSAAAIDEVIVLDTEGIWWLDVKCYFFGADINVGQRLYIDTAGIVSDDITGMPFGWALGPVADGQTALVAVKVHSTEWLFWVLYWYWQTP